MLLIVRGVAAVAASALSMVALVHSEPAHLSTVAHVGIVVRDANRAEQAWGEMFHAVVGTPRSTGRIASAIDVRLDNLTIELVQPDEGPSAWRTFLDAHGEGVHHVAFEAVDVPAATSALVSIGGRLLDGANAASALVDFDREVGGAIEVIRASAQSAPATSAAPSSRTESYVAAIGHLTSDAERARRFWASVLRLDVPPARDTKGVPFPPDCQCDRGAYIREVNIRLPAMAINLIQPVGGVSIWRQLIDRHEGIDYLQFNVPSQAALDARIAFLLEHGGRRTLGDTGAPYAYIDLQDRLGVTLLLVKSTR